MEGLYDFQFIRDDESDNQNSREYEVRSARRFYDQLYREVVILDLSQYEKHVGMRWRVEQEVIEGKGEGICGSNSCSSTQELSTYELPFQYSENDEVKCELVKAKVCPGCFEKLVISHQLTANAAERKYKRSKH